MNKLLSALLLLSATPALAQGTINLSQSSTFATKANLASPTFTGSPTAPTPAVGDTSTRIATAAFVNNTLGGYQNDARFNRTVFFSAGNTSSFYASYGSGPYLNFAPNVLLQWNPDAALMRLETYVGTGAPKATLSASGAAWTVPISAPSLAMAPTSGGGRPSVSFDGSASRIEFEAGGAYVFWVGGVKVARLDGNGNLSIRGTLTQSKGTNCC